MRRLISSGSVFEGEIGYSRAVVQDGWVFVAGTTGFDYATMEISPDVADQAAQGALVQRVLLRAGGAAQGRYSIGLRG